MMLIDTMEIVSECLHREKVELHRVYRELIDAMLPYRNQGSGTWY